MPHDDDAYTTLDDQAAIDGVRLAVRTLEHHLTNHLTLTVGYAELLVEDPELPERLRDMARAVLESAIAAVDTVRRMRHLEEFKLIDLGLPGGPLIELGPPREQW